LLDSLLQETHVRKLAMLLNFSTNAEEHGNRLREVFQSFEVDSKTLLFSASTAEQIVVPGSVKLFSPFLRELVASQSFSTENQILLILPDCSPTSIKHLINLLSDGCTQTSADVDVETILQVARMLEIDIKNISYDDININDLKIGVEEHEKCEKQPDDEYYEDIVKEEMDKDDLKTFSVKSLKIANFAKADLAIPNVNQSQSLESNADSSSNLEIISNIKTLEQSNLDISSLDIPNLGQLKNGHYTVQNQCLASKKVDRSKSEFKKSSFNNENKLAENKTSSLRELEAIFSQGNSFKCNFCEKRFSRKWELLKHCSNVHQRRPYGCLFCESSFLKMQSLKKHIMKCH